MIKGFGDIAWRVQMTQRCGRSGAFSLGFGPFWPPCTRILVVVAIGIAGCSSKNDWVWVKSGGTQAQLESDLAQCQYEVAAATSYYGMYTPNYNPYGDAGSAALQIIGQSMFEEARRNELLTLCLQARGVYKVKRY